MLVVLCFTLYSDYIKSNLKSAILCAPGVESIHYKPKTSASYKITSNTHVKIMKEIDENGLGKISTGAFFAYSI
jgi:hypothetical protein